MRESIRTMSYGELMGNEVLGLLWTQIEIELAWVIALISANSTVDIAT